METRKLNPQALAVREPRVVTNIVVDEGRVFVGEDLVSAEPMITAILANDPYYRYAVYDGIGKKPFYQKQILMVNDIYLMYASVCPVTQDKVKKNFDCETWLTDPDASKRKLKKERELCKVVVLSAGYGVGKKKLSAIFRERGYELDYKTVSDAHDAYWGLFGRLKQTSDFLQSLFVAQGYLINPFGYRLVPRNSKDAFNAVCQSSVSGLINYFMQLKFEHAAKLDMKFVTCIHDCLVTDVPESNIEASRQVTQEVLAKLNEELKWEIPVRTDFTVSKDFYGLKGN